jgi:hypothetical protein
MFASSSNALVQRFVIWMAEQDNEREDAFSAKPWDVTMCLQCKQELREIGFYFPPNNLEDKVVLRARSDGARGWFPVPYSAKAGFWQCLTREATARFDDIANGHAFTHAGARKTGLHSLFFEDFAESADTSAPACVGARLPRPRGETTSGAARRRSLLNPNYSCTS